MNKGFIATFVVTGLVIGMLLTWQFNTKVPVGSFPTDEVKAKEELLKSYLDEQSYLQSKIVSLRKKIESMQDAIDTQSERSSLLLLESLKRDVGLTEINGVGLEILLDDSPFAQRAGVEVLDASLVQASDIRDIVNVLNAANADAISVNNQRVIANSPISSVGTTILINNSYIAPPFNITAVGDIEIMLQRLLTPSLLPDIYDRLRLSNIVFEIHKKSRVTVPIYNGDLKTNYITLVE